MVDDLVIEKLEKKEGRDIWTKVYAVGDIVEACHKLDELMEKYPSREFRIIKVLFEPN